MSGERALAYWLSGFFNLTSIFPFQRKQSISPDPNFNKHDPNQRGRVTELLGTCARCTDPTFQLIKQRSTTLAILVCFIASRSQSSRDMAPSELDALSWHKDLWGGCCQLSSSSHTHLQRIQQLLSRGVIHEGLLPTRRRHSRKRSLIVFRNLICVRQLGASYGAPGAPSSVHRTMISRFRGSNGTIRILVKVDSPVGIIFYATMS
jgi:hypothetical protein